MQRTKAYLPKLGIKFPSNTDEWREINRYGVIRNKIMHEGGVVPTTGDAADYARNKGIVSYSRSKPSYALNREFCEKAIVNFERFIVMLHEAYREGSESPRGN